jgi:hypothetical protein
MIEASSSCLARFGNYSGSDCNQLLFPAHSSELFGPGSQRFAPARVDLSVDGLRTPPLRS